MTMSSHLKLKSWLQFSVDQKPLKERTTRAERRAKQEGDREAKRAARESG